jgi:ribonucleoside-diphosphate reductase alpha chain
MAERVLGTLRREGEERHYFASPGDGRNFQAELTYLLLHQMACFNGPIMALLGRATAKPTASCFIHAVDDTMESILDLAQNEAHLLKAGCSSGTNFSPLRASHEPLSGGGIASGPVSFMRGLDAFAGVIKEGGQTQSAAKLALLNDDHPDWLEFVQSKAHEENKARALVAAGYPSNRSGPAYESLSFQNTHTAIRISDALVDATAGRQGWATFDRCSGSRRPNVAAVEVLDQVSRAIHATGEPRVHFTDTIDRWHTCGRSGPITASTPCGEFLFLDNSACNLATLNVLRFLGTDGSFDVAAFVQAVQLVVTAQDILVDVAQYPTEAIAATSHRFRPLGLGYTNLASLLRALNLSYDSIEGRAFAAALTGLMTGAAYNQSARLAQTCGPFADNQHQDESSAILRQHAEALDQVTATARNGPLLDRARQEWTLAINGAQTRGLRNAQVTALSTTATASFLLDSECPGIEPHDNASPPSPTAQLLMVAALQPLLSGGISKTIVLPPTTTTEDVQALLVQAHQMGVKTVSLRRDGARREPTEQALTSPTPNRRRLPDERHSVTHKFTIAGHKGYLTVGMYGDGTPGEIFIRMAKAGSVVAGLMDSIGLAVSLALQYGVPLQVLVDKYAHSRFEPSGFTGNEEIPMAKSIMDYIFRWLELRFLSASPAAALPSPPAPRPLPE